MNKITPGPRVVYDDGPDGSDVILARVDDENWDIAYMADDRPAEERKANARLIAAVPDLLEAAKQALVQMDAYLDYIRSGDPDLPMEHAAENLSLAISKAEGKE